MRPPAASRVRVTQRGFSQTVVSSSSQLSQVGYWVARSRPPPWRRRPSGRQLPRRPLAVGGDADTSTARLRTDCGAFRPFTAYLSCNNRRGRHAAADTALRSESAARCGAVEHHLIDRVADRWTILCSRVIELRRRSQGSAVSLAACGTAAVGADGCLTSAIFAFPGVCSSTRGRGALETAAPACADGPLGQSQ